MPQEVRLHIRGIEEAQRLKEEEQRLKEQAQRLKKLQLLNLLPRRLEKQQPKSSTDTPTSTWLKQRW
jgi:hypothetical protein